MSDEPLAQAPGAMLDALWHQLLSRWEDPDAHAAFLRAAETSGRLADAAMRYRGMTGDRQRRETAETQLSAITVLALAGLESARTEVPSKRRLGGILALALAIFFLSALLLLAKAV